MLTHQLLLVIESMCLKEILDRSCQSVYLIKLLFIKFLSTPKKIEKHDGCYIPMKGSELNICGKKELINQILSLFPLNIFIMNILLLRYYLLEKVFGTSYQASTKEFFFFYLFFFRKKVLRCCF